MTIDVLAIGAHPDDADLGVGGILLKLSQRGYSTGMLDLTRAELSSRGDVNSRAEEAAEAAKRLGAHVRENAGLVDGALADTLAQREVVVRHLRALRPRMVIAPMTPDRHPDHEAAYSLCRSAFFFTRVDKFDTQQEAYKPETILFYHAYFQPSFPPSVIVDISEQFEAKIEALRAFRSQFQSSGGAGKETMVSSQAFWENIETRARYWGARVGARYGEPLYAEGPLPADLPPGLGEPSGS